MSGAPVNVLAGGPDSNITVIVAAHPIPTAQIAIFLFEDNYPLNGTPTYLKRKSLHAGQVGAEAWARSTGPSSTSSWRTRPASTAARRALAAGRLRQPARHRLQRRAATTPRCHRSPWATAPCIPDANGYLPSRTWRRASTASSSTRPPANPAMGSGHHHRGHQGHRRLGQGQRAALLRRVRPAEPHVFMGFIQTDRIGRPHSTAAVPRSPARSPDTHFSRPPGQRLLPRPAVPQLYRRAQRRRRTRSDAGRRVL